MQRPVQATIGADRWVVFGQLSLPVPDEVAPEAELGESISSGQLSYGELSGSGRSTNFIAGLQNENWVMQELAALLAQEGVELFPDSTSSSDFAPDAELTEAIYDLRNARDEAREEGFPLPSDTALQNAEILLKEVYGISPRRFEVYPTPDGEIAIDAPGGPGRSVLLLCGSEGGALCLVNMSGDHRRARYSTTETLPDGFVREALDELEPESEQAP